MWKPRLAKSIGQQQQPVPVPVPKIPKRRPQNQEQTVLLINHTDPRQQPHHPGMYPLRMTQSTSISQIMISTQNPVLLWNVTVCMGQARIP